MSVTVNKVTKIYGNQKALDEVSFEISSGQIVGLLGPNGAGKSTMMKIITCYLTASMGSVTVNGFDVIANPVEVRRQVGYLPEHNPLYQDMYVKEYLSFVAGIYMPFSKVKNRVREMIELTGLQEEQHKKIGALSKGYKQRVGLAQALIHDPSVLILDEPTSGLDPNQLIGIRQLIRNAGKEKTIILSTHIMQEVEAICNRVIIINKGKIVADDSVEILTRHINSDRVFIIEFDREVEEGLIKNLPFVHTAELIGTFKWRVSAKNNADIRPELSRFAQQNQLLILSLSTEEIKLETVFHQLTAR
jgi:ABC-2 type transport system ATP-binding protein